MGKIMKIKDKIKVGGLVFRVKDVSGLADYGSTDFDRQIILIKKELTDDNKESTLYHEIVEIINNTYDLNLSHQTIQTIEASIFQIIKDNYVNKGKKRS